MPLELSFRFLLEYSRIHFLENALLSRIDIVEPVVNCVCHRPPYAAWPSPRGICRARWDAFSLSHIYQCATSMIDTKEATCIIFVDVNGFRVL